MTPKDVVPPLHIRGTHLWGHTCFPLEYSFSFNKADECLSSTVVSA